MHVHQQNSTARTLVGILLVFALGALLGGCRKYPNCRTDEHCERFEEREPHGTPFCVNRMCVECRDDTVCGVCESCRSGECSAISGCCTGDPDCPTPGRCWDNNQNPVAGGAEGRCGPQCYTDAHCEGVPGEHVFCISGRCTEAECTNDDHCAQFFPDRCLDAQGRNMCRCRGNVCEVQGPELCSPDPVFFDFDESRIRNDQELTLDGNVTCINGERSGMDVMVEGHCDERGTDAYNIALGERRANRVRDYVEEAGVDEDRLDTVSYGENQPSCRTSGESCWSQNRRAEFTLSN